MGTEGINGGVSGKEEDAEAFKRYIKEKSSFKDLTFREQTTEKITYAKLTIRIRKEIVAFGKEVNLKDSAKHISPKELKSLLDNNEAVVLLDARNDYEVKVGKFKNATTLAIESFKEFPKAATKELSDKKDKKIIMYCTGGVRCEKSSAYLREQGFKDVSQLQGGIINYISQFPDTHFEGSCFVFDDRIVSKVGNKALNTCTFCDMSTDDCINCHNMDCDKLFLACDTCQQTMKGTCSETCFKAPRQRGEKTRQIPLHA